MLSKSKRPWEVEGRRQRQCRIMGSPNLITNNNARWWVVGERGHRICSSIGVGTCNIKVGDQPRFLSIARDGINGLTPLEGWFGVYSRIVVHCRTLRRSRGFSGAKRGCAILLMISAQMLHMSNNVSDSMHAKLSVQALLSQETSDKVGSRILILQFVLTQICIPNPHKVIGPERICLHMGLNSSTQVVFSHIFDLPFENSILSRVMQNL